ncbi:MAG: methyltransferase domain-containing protein [Candidatus Omnitrophica bacterium]|nr:methyltransferase domain-containing protein [Candidatus Omnitrophota bacterium]
MDKNVIKYLACPKKLSKGTCRGELALDEVFSFHKSNTDEIEQGYIKCRRCGASFPIFFAIPVLISDLGEYLKSNLSIILELSRKYGRLDKDLIADSLLSIKRAKRQNQEALFTRPKNEYKNRINTVFESHYITSHYDDLLSLARRQEPLYDFIDKYRLQTPHLMLKGFLKRYAKNGRSLALEVGCNVGGFLPYLSEYAEHVFGLDNSFGHLFFASCLLKHIPIRIKDYNAIGESGIKKKRPLKKQRLKNLTLIAADGSNLPFRGRSLSIALSCNLIDAIDNPKNMLKEKMRVLKKGGLLLSSDPYQFLGEHKRRLNLEKGQSPWQNIKKILKPKVKIIEARDNTPWITRSYKRSYSIYYNHSFCARKKDK